VFSSGSFHPLVHEILTTLFIPNSKPSVAQKALAQEIIHVGHEVLGYLGGLTTKQINDWFTNARRRSVHPSDVISDDTRDDLSWIFLSSSSELTERERAVLIEDFTKDIVALKKKSYAISDIEVTADLSAGPGLEAEEGFGQLKPRERKRKSSTTGPKKKRLCNRKSSEEPDAQGDGPKDGLFGGSQKCEPAGIEFQDELVALDKVCAEFQIK
jgi:hypothetical protein